MAVAASKRREDAPKRPAPSLPSARVPEGIRVYAIGDVHGRSDLLRSLLEKIVDDSMSLTDVQKFIVFLGDYIDRGPDSRGVLDILSNSAPIGFKIITLKGNHEHVMLRFLYHATVGPQWLAIGGGATLESYGIGSPLGFSVHQKLTYLQETLRERMPQAHLDFLFNLKPCVTIGDYLFVHAGVRPGVPLNRQLEQDVLWIRDEFLSADQPFGKVVVHGHTINPVPDARLNRLGIDTGAYHSGRLTCVVLEGMRKSFLHT